jgi:CHAD domain-containing protein
MDAGDDQPVSYRAAMRELIGERFRHVWKAIPGAIEGVDPDGVHDVRVASRRLRAAMDVSAGCFPKSWFEPLHKTAKAMTTSLGAVRDRDVLLEFLTAERASAPASDRPGIDLLIARVERERDAARTEMIAFLDTVEEGGTPKESVRRFGVVADPEHERDAS